MCEKDFFAKPHIKLDPDVEINFMPGDDYRPPRKNEWLIQDQAEIDESRIWNM